LFREGYIRSTNWFNNTISTIDISMGNFVATISIGTGPVDICFDGSYIWVANGSDGTLSKINPLTDTIEKTMAAGYGP
jgi:YVTN family beta-propeller protein